MKAQDIKITISDLKKMFPNDVSDDLADDFFIAKLRAYDKLDFFTHPCRFDGILAYYCIKGSFTIEMNLLPIEIRERSFLLYIPGSIARCPDIDSLKDSECVIVAASRKLVDEAHIDFSRLYEDSIKLMSDPCISLSEDEFDICKNYFTLTESLLMSGQTGIRESISSLGASIFFYLGQVWRDRISKAKIEPVSSSLRTKLIFENFMKLVSEHHNEHHNVGFYAERLCLTPKYLSQVIRKISGKSAPDWIDSFIVQEAKGLLKYSDCDVKEIVYRLNFNSQSVFYRFFKAHTGLTPAEYRKQ